MNLRTKMILRFTARLLFVITTSTVASAVIGQNIEDTRSISDALDRFSLNFLAKTFDEAGPSLNLALSPYTVWSLMSIVAEGARENTARELEITLGIPSSENEKIKYRNQYRSLTNYLTKRATEGVSLEINNAIFTTIDESLSPEFNYTVRTYYDTELKPVDFKNVPQAVSTINRYVEQATRGKIPDLITTDDLDGAEIFLTSTLFFKGLWKRPFNRTTTRRDPFYDELGNRIGEVDMMYLKEAVPYTLILDSQAIATELGYKGDRMAMILILPRKNVSLQSVSQKIASRPFSEVVIALNKASQLFEDPVIVQIPKFKIISDLNLNRVLDGMGIRDVLNQGSSNLSGMFKNYLYISRIIQRAQIEVDEEGTTATAASGAAFQNRMTPPKFIANKPFLYMIYDKETQGIVFAGKVSNPKALLRPN